MAADAPFPAGTACRPWIRALVALALFASQAAAGPPPPKRDVTITIEAWLWDGDSGSGFLTPANWFNGFGFLNPPYTHPVWIGPVVQYVNGILIDPFIPTGAMPLLSSDFTGPSFKLAGSDIPVSLTLDNGATYTVGSAQVGVAPHPDYTPAGAPTAAILHLAGGAAISGSLSVGVDAIGQLSVTGSASVDDLTLASGADSVAILDVGCGASLQIHGSLTTGSGQVVLSNCGQVHIPDGETLTVSGGPHSLGEIVLQSAGSFSRLAFSADATLNGDGIVTLSDHASGNNTLGDGSLDALLTVPAGASVTLRDGLGSIRNDLAVQGTLQVTGGAEVEVTDVIDGTAPGARAPSSTSWPSPAGPADPPRRLGPPPSVPLEGTAAGTVRVLDGSILRVGANGGTLRGSLLETEGTGEFRGEDHIASAAGTIEDSILSGRLRLAGGELINLAGAVRNDGEILVGDTTFATLVWRTPTTLEGNGLIILSSSPTRNRLGGGNFDATLTVPAGASMNLNGGLGEIDSDLAIQGTLQVMAGADVEVQGGVTIDGGAPGARAGGSIGTLRVLDGSILRVRANDATLRDSILETEGTGEFRGADHIPSAAGVIEDSILAGRLRLANSEVIALAGWFRNDGEIVLESAGGITTLVWRTPTTLLGNGTITMSGGPANRLGGNFDDATLTVPAGASMNLHGGLGLIQNNLAILGTLQVMAGADVEIQGGTTIDGTATGTVRVLDGSILRVRANGGTVRNSLLETTGTGEFRGDDHIPSAAGVIADSILAGRLRLAGGEVIALAGVMHNDGEIIIGETGSSADLVTSLPTAIGGDGTITCNGHPGGASSITGELLILGSGQRLEGECRVESQLDHDGTLAPGNGIGTMTLAADVTLLANARFEAEVGPASSDLLEVTSAWALTLGGALRPVVADDDLALIDPAAEYVIAEASSGSILGQFTNAAPGDRVVGANGASFRVEYGPGAADPEMIVLTDFLLIATEIFTDGFESGDAAAWSGIAGGS